MTDQVPAPPQFRFWGAQKPRVMAAATPKTVGTTATIRVYGPIDSWGGWWGTSAKEVAEVLDGLDDSVQTVQLRLNSPGGDAFEGVAIMNLLRAHKARTVAVVDGLAASAASIIAAGCDELVMSPGSELMIHDASTMAYGDAAEMEKAGRMLTSVSNTIASVYAAKTSGSLEDWRALMVAETWYTAEEAVSAGLADRADTVPDSGPTETAGGEPDAAPVGVEDAFDLSIFNYAGRSHAPAPKPPSASAVGSPPTKEETLVNFTDEQITALRKQIGFPEDADAATITAAVTEALGEQVEPPRAASTPTAAVPEGMVLVDSAVLDELRTGAAAGRSARDELHNQARDRAIDDAVRQGKTTAARREHWIKSWAADSEGTKALLDSLEPGLAVPVNELGDAGQPESESLEAEIDAFAAAFGIKTMGA